jgi:hypothetical protein
VRGSGQCFDINSLLHHGRSLVPRIFHRRLRFWIAAFNLTPLSVRGFSSINSAAIKLLMIGGETVRHPYTFSTRAPAIFYFEQPDNPDFYRQLGKEPELMVGTALDALARRFSLNFTLANQRDRVLVAD